MATLEYHVGPRGTPGYTVTYTSSNGMPYRMVIPAFVQVDSTGAESPAGTPGAPLYATTAKAATGATTSVPAAAADTLILAANTNRLPGSTIANDSTAIMYVLFGSGAASTTNYTAAIDGKTTVPGVLTLPDGYVGAVRAYWASATGSARVTELSA